MSDLYCQGSTRLPFSRDEMIRLADLLAERNASPDPDSASLEIDVEERIIFSMDDFRAEVVGELVSAVLAERPDGDMTEIEIEFAMVANKPVPGEFGGGRIHVTREGIEVGPKRFVAVTSIEGELGASVHQSKDDALSSIAMLLADYGYGEEASISAMAAFIAEANLGISFAVHEARVC